jgi:hypothetical protein
MTQDQIVRAVVLNMDPPSAVKKLEIVFAVCRDK